MKYWPDIQLANRCKKLLDSALCSVKMDLCTVEELNRDDNLISDIVVVIYLEEKT